MRGRTNRRRKTIKKVSVKPKSRKAPNCQRFQHSSLDYDDEASQFANYQRLGLLADPNQIQAVHDRITGFKPRVKVPGAAEAAASSVEPSSEPHPLELEMPEALKTVRKVPLGERQVLLKLVAKHGDDYAAMARDMKLNAMQHTAAHLRRRIAKMGSEDAEEAEEAAAMVAQGKEAPPPRLRRKLTKHPNSAFHKSSMNFM